MTDMHRKKKRIIAIALIIMMAGLAALSGCGMIPGAGGSNNPGGSGSSGQGSSDNPGGSGDLGGSGSADLAGKSLMDGIKADITISEEEMNKALQGPGNDYLNKFALAIMKEAMKNEEGNLLISPISIIYAMAMTANGADGMTECELLEALSEGEFTGEAKCGTSSTGVGDIWDEIRGNLNEYLRAYLNSTIMAEAHDREFFPRIYEYEETVPEPSYLRIANSIWFKNDPGLKVEKKFLETNGKYYDAGVYEREFNDATRQEINSWIEEKTQGTIKDMLKEMPDEAIMFLVNALAFQGEWDEPFEEYQIQQRTFHGENGDVKGIDFMNGTNELYIEDGKATGFMKYYKGYKYAFVALLPNEGTTVDEYLNSLDGAALKGLTQVNYGQEVIFSMPKFTEESALSLVDVFKGLGVENPFDSENANFTDMATSARGNIYIGDILHNTYIDVNENGTTAGAATVVVMAEEGMIEDPPKPKEVILDRPFVYMLADVEQGIPLFIGVIKDIEPGK